MAVRSLFFYCSLPLLVFGALNSGDITAKKFLIQACPQGWVAYQECCYLFENRTMKWLVNPFSASGNGWSAASKCVAYLNSDAESARYLYFYPCDSLFQSVCERNLTFNSALARQAGSL
ncbi:unnamed protein product [Heligmosomoides polygyrus]|uniref:C-type lectin domain-containing protein n=1 Tax=Heligmosomoides polygyrus TaxID=6339 RepID=A0A183G0T4_HELPZ|nr:unnamed protein product [Heligmosomoides polygyrus]